MISAIIIATVLLIHIFFFIAILRKNFAVIDIGWGAGFILISLMAYLLNPLTIKNAFLLIVVCIWGMRLSIYIFKRSKGKPEDPRYNSLRNEWRPHENLQAYFKIFLFQGALMMVISLPVTTSMALEKTHFSVLNWIGFFVWLSGFTLEVWADSYLRVWKSRKENQGEICTTGPWRLCRFPNYFGEVCLWYGIYLMAFDPRNSWTIIGPLILNSLILKVTGVPLLEARYKNRPAYQEYAKKVPRFIPFTKP